MRSAKEWEERRDGNRDEIRRAVRSEEPTMEMRSAEGGKRRRGEEWRRREEPMKTSTESRRVS
jgi:hypothetical protein